jgi:hypothetical protein
MQGKNPGLQTHNQTKQRENKAALGQAEESNQKL